MGLTLHQVETVDRDGAPRQVVAWVYKNRIVESPAWERCLVVGLGCALLGGAAGNRLGAGGEFGSAVVGAAVVIGLAWYVDSLMPNMHGRVGEQSHESLLLFAGLLGAAAGAQASLNVRSRRRTGG